LLCVQITIYLFKQVKYFNLTSQTFPSRHLLLHFWWRIAPAIGQSGARV